MDIHTLVTVSLTTVVSANSFSRSSSSTPSNSSSPTSSQRSPSSRSGHSSSSSSAVENCSAPSALLSASSSMASEPRPALKGFRSALAESCILWLKHRTQLTSSNELSFSASFTVCLLFKDALSPLYASIYIIVSRYLIHYRL